MTQWTTTVRYVWYIQITKFVGGESTILRTYFYFLSIYESKWTMEFFTNEPPKIKILNTLLVKAYTCTQPFWFWSSRGRGNSDAGVWTAKTRRTRSESPLPVRKCNFAGRFVDVKAVPYSNEMTENRIIVIVLYYAPSWPLVRRASHGTILTCSFPQFVRPVSNRIATISATALCRANRPLFVRPTALSKLLSRSIPV